MSHQAATIQEPVELRPEQGKALELRLLIAGAAGAALSVVGLALGEESRQQFFFSYLTAYIFVIQIALGCMFWVLLHHVVDAGWSVVVRRIAENYASFLLYAGVFFLPVLAGMGTIYSWTHAQEEGTEAAHLLHIKAPYLNVPFFIIRAAVYFAVWAWLAWRFNSLSREQDRTRDPELTKRMQKLAPVGLILLGLTSAFAGIDWVMALDFTWFSTMFGVYFWAGCFLASIATIALTVVVMRSKGFLTKSITEEHLHDLGKLCFAFVTFWAYITFSQYFLTWYADQPEEITYFTARRWVGHGSAEHTLGTWHWLGVVIVFCHVIVPFLVLLPRSNKRRPAVLGMICAWILVIRLVELHWQVLPTLHKETFTPCWLDLMTLLALCGAGGFLVLRQARRQALLPVGDPRLAESLAFENAC